MHSDLAGDDDFLKRHAAAHAMEEGGDGGREEEEEEEERPSESVFDGIAESLRTMFVVEPGTGCTYEQSLDHLKYMPAPPSRLPPEFQIDADSSGAAANHLWGEEATLEGGGDAETLEIEMEELEGGAGVEGLPPAEPAPPAALLSMEIALRDMPFIPDDAPRGPVSAEGTVPRGKVERVSLIIAWEPV